jgi:hypothetical protein
MTRRPHGIHEKFRLRPLSCLLPGAIISETPEKKATSERLRKLNPHLSFVLTLQRILFGTQRIHRNSFDGTLFLGILGCMDSRTDVDG